MAKTLNKIILGLLALYATATLIDFNIDARQAKITSLAFVNSPAAIAALISTTISRGREIVIFSSPLIFTPS